MLGWPRAGFGDYLRARLEREGKDPTLRQALQDLGQALVESDPDQFCRDVLDQVGFRAGGNLLLDGMRHVGIHRRIVKIVVPSRAILLHLGVGDNLVADRVLARDHATSDLLRAEAHKVEQDLRTSLPGIADRIVDAGAPLHDVINACLSTMQDFGTDRHTIEAARTGLSTLRN